MPAASAGSLGSRGIDVDVVVVGARCAGSAAAIAFAQAGRSVVALDAARFPSATISTHLLWAGGVAELDRLGARERVEATGAPRLPVGYAALPGAPAVRATYTPVDGIAYGLCVRRYGLDAALVATSREAGADVREQTRVESLLWDRGRVVGVVARPRYGEAYELRAHLVVGADGRRSTVAALVGAAEPHTWNPNERACYYAYFADLHEDWRPVAAQWREGAELGTAFPCDGGLTLVHQGIRDALRFGRLLGETTAAVLDDPARLDPTLAAWERRRDDECRETYEWTNFVARAAPVGALDVALFTHFARPEHAHELLDLHSRVLRPSEVLTPELLAGAGG